MPEPSPTPDPYAWTRPKPLAPRSVKSVPLTIFYGWPARVVADVCRVTLHTAYCYKNGSRKPSDQAVRLMQLHAAGRVLDGEWTRWRLSGSTITDPEGNTTTQAQLRGYAMLMQLMAHWARDDASKRAELDAILTIMDTRRRA